MKNHPAGALHQRLDDNPRELIRMLCDQRIESRHRVFIAR